MVAGWKNSRRRPCRENLRCGSAPGKVVFVILNKRSCAVKDLGEPRDASHFCDAIIACLARFLIKLTHYRGRLPVDSLSAGFYSNYVFRPSYARVACCCCMCRLACG